MDDREKHPVIRGYASGGLIMPDSSEGETIKAMLDAERAPITIAPGERVFRPIGFLETGGKLPAWYTEETTSLPPRQKQHPMSKANKHRW